MKFTDEETIEVTVEEVERQLLLEFGGSIEGTDSNDAIYSSISELWKVELSNTKEKQKSKKSKKGEETSTKGNGSRWYRKAYDFWEGYNFASNIQSLCCSLSYCRSSKLSSIG